MKREMRLMRDPAVNPVTLAVLVRIASAIEQEAVQRYTTLAEAMRRRGEVATAAAFQVMLDEERRHVAAVDRWAAGLDTAARGAEAFEWRVPAELSDAWNEVAGSARLTPYRAFAIAADNEQRAFALYSYLAAAATEPQVAAEAERLALEELRHAALVRRWRRQAWHRERREPQGEPLHIGSSGQLQALLARHEAAIAARHRALATRLRELGDDESAQCLDALGTPSVAPAEGEVVRLAGDAATSGDPVHLLVAAQAPLEALGETLEQLLPALEGELFAEAANALGNVVARLARLALQTERRLRSAAR
ncbi:MAG: hypothetical protein KF891_23300 [Rhizobacter sp.]|nr:hypothetical protein [Rhizobacter sp.]